MKEKVTSASSKKHRLLKAGLLVTVVLMATSWIGYFATYPTDSHRNIDQQTMEVLSLEPSATLTQAEIDARYDKLSATAESQYSTAATAIVLLAQILVYVGVIYYLYKYVRRNGLARKAVGAATLIMVGASVVESTVTWLIYDGGVSAISFFTLLPILAVVIAVLSFVVASLCESWYKRRNSFEM